MSAREATSLAMTCPARPASGKIADCLKVDRQLRWHETASRRVSETDPVSPPGVADTVPVHSSRWPVQAPLLGLLGLTLLFRWTNLDLDIASVCFDPVVREWRWTTLLPVRMLYSLGTYPALLLAAIGGVSWFCGAKSAGGLLSVQGGKFLVLLFAIGPGLVVNAGFKQTWGRPRPSQVRQFGGVRDFVPVGTPLRGQIHNSSFPSGHAATAFFLMATAFLVDRRKVGLRVGLLVAGCVYGTLMGLARMLQGGHWASDVLWSAAIVYFLAVTLDRFVLRSAGTTNSRSARR